MHNETIIIVLLAIAILYLCQSEKGERAGASSFNPLGSGSFQTGTPSQELRQKIRNAESNIGKLQKFGPTGPFLNPLSSMSPEAQAIVNATTARTIDNISPVVLDTQSGNLSIIPGSGSLKPGTHFNPFGAGINSLGGIRAGSTGMMTTPFMEGAKSSASLFTLG